jgi:hypothetical protein
VAYFTTEGDATPPVMGLVFADGRPATTIFEQWRRAFGDQDQDERLYVTIVQGISKRNPASYRVLIGASPAVVLQDESVKYAFLPYRIQTMEATSATHLDGFLRSYAAVGRYILAPAVVPIDAAVPVVAEHLGIEKVELQVKLAWQVGRHDLEVSAINIDDDLIIPEGITPIPVAEVLAFKRRGGTPLE